MISFKSFLSENTKTLKKSAGARVMRVARRVRRNAKGQIVVQRNKKVRNRKIKGYKLVGTQLRRMTAQEIRARSGKNPNRRMGFRRAKTKSAQRLRRWKQSNARRQGWG
jgi:hypothetical protein